MLLWRPYGQLRCWKALRSALEAGAVERFLAHGHTDTRFLSSTYYRRYSIEYDKAN